MEIQNQEEELLVNDGAAAKPAASETEGKPVKEKSPRGRKPNSSKKATEAAGDPNVSEAGVFYVLGTQSVDEEPSAAGLPTTEPETFDNLAMATRTAWRENKLFFRVQAMKAKETPTERGITVEGVPA
jgi:hypothetical protein